ncbi:MAG: mobile mystery protein B [Oceanospirillaceae bacterium]|nr:mobile mystery protein B [Oceanospirillaceae bacterium]
MGDQMIFDEPYGATPLDPDEAEGLKISHISTREELNRWEQENINQAYSWCEKRRNKKNVASEEFLTTLHKQMFGKVWQWAGDLRQSDKSIGIDWVQVPIELRQLLNDINYWIEHETYPPDEIAVRFHHRLVWIHLFPNGNGRHARLATDRLLIDVFGLEPFTWGNANIDRQGDVRSQYIQALRQADNHDYPGLMKFVRA